MLYINFLSTRFFLTTESTIFVSVKKGNMLTLDNLKEMEPGAIIATGVIQNDHLYHKPVRWVAKRGRVHDWALYYDKEEKSQIQVENNGNKCFTESVIRQLVPCDDAAMRMYRF